MVAEHTLYNFFSSKILFKSKLVRGAWVAQLVERPTSAQVTILQSVSSSLTSGSALTVWSLLGILSVSLSLSLSLCPSPAPTVSVSLKINNIRGAWVAQSVEHPMSAQITISQFVSSRPASSSVPIAQSLEPASDSVSPLSLSLSAPPTFTLHLSQK